jgi:tetratricopeptide (TPR) repeat protein
MMNRLPIRNFGLSKTLLLAAMIVLTAAQWFFMPLGLADGALDVLEFRLLGKRFPTEAAESRVARLEQLLGQPASPKTSLEYRLSRLVAVQALQVSRQNQEAAVLAYNQGVEAAEAGDYEQAVEAYYDAIRLNPGLIQAYNNLGSLLEHLQKYPEAIEIYERAIRQDPTDPLLHRNLGIVCEKMGNLDKAVAEYRNYARLAQTPDPAVQSILEQYEEQKRIPNAATDYVKSARSVSAGKKLLWPKQQLPLRVYIQLDPDQVPFLPAIQESLKHWESASNGRIRFKEVADEEDASIVIHLKDGPLAHPYLDVGHASFNVEDAEGNRERGVKVSITVNTGERTVPIPLQDRLVQVKRLTLHEIGHAIGIWGHSPSPGDIMFSRPFVSALSERDINTLNKLYADQ